MTGMVLARNFDRLRHAKQPDYFDPVSDSHYVVEALSTGTTNGAKKARHATPGVTLSIDWD